MGAHLDPIHIVRTTLRGATVASYLMLTALNAHAAEQCVQNACDQADAEVKAAIQFTERMRTVHFNKLQSIVAESLATDRVKFLEHLKALSDFSTVLDAIDAAANEPKDLQVDRLAKAVNDMLTKKTDLETIRRTKGQDESAVAGKVVAYRAALDVFYTESIKIFNPVNGLDLYGEAESHVEGQKNKNAATQSLALRYEALQSFTQEWSRGVKGTIVLKGLDNFANFLTKPIGKLVAAIGKETSKPLDCAEWLKDRKEASLTLLSETAQALVCEQVALEQAQAKQAAVCPPCQAKEEPKPQPQAAAGVRVVSAIYGRLSRDPITAVKKRTLKNGKEVKKTVILGYKTYYRKSESCDATNYFREKCGFLIQNVKYCVVTATRKLAWGDACKDGTAGIEMVDNISEFFARESGQVPFVCRVEIDPRRICGSYVPAEYSDRLATIRYKCSDDAKAPIWQVAPLKRDKEMAYLICPNGNQPAEYAQAPAGPIPVEPKEPVLAEK